MKIAVSFLLVGVCLLVPFQSLNAQNTGINTTTPQATLDVNGDIILRTGVLSAADGINSALDVNAVRFSYYRITGPTANFTIAGITAGIDGRLITFFNRSGFAMQLNNENAAVAIPDMILTGTNGDIIIPDKGIVSLQYDGVEQKWIIKSSNKGGSGGSNTWDTNGNDIYNTNPGNVGIGTSSPVSRLTMQTAINSIGWTHIGGSDSIIVNEAIGGISASIGTETNHAFRIKAGGLGKLHIYPAGEVVVGSNATGSLGKFTVESASNSYGISHTGGGVTISSFVGGSLNAGYFGTQSNHPLSFYTNNSASQVILKTNGNFGIGTANPVSRLQVAGDETIEGNTYVAGDELIGGNSTVSGNVGLGVGATPGVRLHINQAVEALRLSGNQPYMTFFNLSTFKGYMRSINADDMEIGTAPGNTNGKLNFSTQGVSRMILNADGKVSINGAPGDYFSPTLTVNGAFSLKISTPWEILALAELQFYKLGTYMAFVDDEDGDWISMSDASLKEKILPYKSVLKDIKDLRVSTYHYKSGKHGTRSFGLIAQNAAKNFPEIVSETQDKNGNNILGIAYGKTGVLAIKAIQEQQEIIEQQQTKIESLEKRLATLENYIQQKIK